jgi:shikimate dehydrogenase
MVTSVFQFVGLLGHPVAQSKSPLMHNAAFRHLNLPYAYAAFDIPPEHLKEAINSLRMLNFRGANVTIPHKVAIMEYLDDISEEAKHIGAVNTLVSDKGRWIGHNTDGIGYVRSLKEETGIQLKGTKVLVLGAGGAARSIAYALLQKEAGGCWIANRTYSRAEQLAVSLSVVGSTHALPWEDISRFAGDFDLIVNTTSVGMYPSVDQMPIAAALLDQFKEEAIVSDLIYNPRQTLLLQEAAKKGIKVHGGLGMFIYQGAYAFEYWTGEKAPTETMRKAIEIEQ